MYLSRTLVFVSPTHEVGNGLADDGAEDECAHKVGQQCEGHASDSQQEVADCQGQQEGVGDRSQASAQSQDHNDEHVSADTHQKDHRVKGDSNGQLQFWVDKRGDCRRT